MKIRSILALACLTHHINSTLKSFTHMLFPQIHRDATFYVPPLFVEPRTVLVLSSLLIQSKTNLHFVKFNISCCIYNIFNAIIIKNFAIYIYMQYHNTIWDLIIKPFLDTLIPFASNPSIFIIKIIILSALEYIITREYNHQNIKNKYKKINNQDIRIHIESNDFSNILMFYILENIKFGETVLGLICMVRPFIILIKNWASPSACKDPDFLTHQKALQYLGTVNLIMIYIMTILEGMAKQHGIKINKGRGKIISVILSMLSIYIKLILSFYICVEYVPDYSKKIPDLSKKEIEAALNDLKLKLIISEYNKRSLEEYLSHLLQSSDNLISSDNKNRVLPGLVIGSQENKTGKSTALDKMILDIMNQKNQNCVLYQIDLAEFTRSVNDLNDKEKINKIKSLLVELAILKQEELEYKKQIIFIVRIEEFDKYPELILFAAKIFHDIQPELNNRCKNKEANRNHKYPGCIFTLFATTNDLFSVVNLFGGDMLASRRIGSIMLDREVETEYKPYYENFKKAENLKILDFGNITEEMVKDKINNMINSLKKNLNIEIEDNDKLKEILLYHIRNLSGKCIFSELLGRINYNLMCELEDRFELSEEEKQSIQEQGASQEKEGKFLEIIDSKLSGIFQNLQNKMLQCSNESLTTSQVQITRTQIETGYMAERLSNMSKVGKNLATDMDNTYQLFDSCESKQKKKEMQEQVEIAMKNMRTAIRDITEESNKIKNCLYGTTLSEFKNAFENLQTKAYTSYESRVSMRWIEQVKIAMVDGYKPLYSLSRSDCRACDHLYTLFIELQNKINPCYESLESRDRIERLKIRMKDAIADITVEGSAYAAMTYFAETLPIEIKKCTQPELAALALTKSLFGYSPMGKELKTTLPFGCNLGPALIARTTDLGQFTDENGEKQYYAHETYISFVCALCDAMFKTNLLESCNSIKYFQEALEPEHREIYLKIRDNNKEILKKTAMLFMSHHKEATKDILNAHKLYTLLFALEPDNRTIQSIPIETKMEINASDRAIMIANQLIQSSEMIEITHLKEDFGMELQKYFKTEYQPYIQPSHDIIKILAKIKVHDDYKKEHVDAIIELRYPIRTTLKKLEAILSAYDANLKLTALKQEESSLEKKNAGIKHELEDAQSQLDDAKKQLKQTMDVFKKLNTTQKEIHLSRSLTVAHRDFIDFAVSGRLTECIADLEATLKKAEDLASAST